MPVSIDTKYRVVSLGCALCGAQTELPIALDAISEGVPSFLDRHPYACSGQRSEIVLG